MTQQPPAAHHTRNRGHRIHPRPPARHSSLRHASHRKYNMHTHHYTTQPNGQPHPHHANPHCRSYTGQLEPAAHSLLHIRPFGGFSLPVLFLSSLSTFPPRSLSAMIAIVVFQAQIERFKPISRSSANFLFQCIFSFFLASSCSC